MLTAFSSPALESTDFSGIDPVYARPIVDNSTAEPELPFADVAFPAKIQSLVSQQTRSGPKASAVLVHGQFFSDDTPDAKGAGNQRLFTRVDLDVLRSNGTDRVAPRYDAIDAVVLPGPGIVSFSADVVDLPGEDAANVARVLVAFRDGTSSTWRFLDLSHGPGASWGGTAPVSGTQIEYFMQAVDASGNVAVSTNKGLLFSAAPPAPPSGTGVEALLTGDKDRRLVLPVGAAGLRRGGGRRCVSVDRPRPAHALHRPGNPRRRRPPHDRRARFERLSGDPLCPGRQRAVRRSTSTSPARPCR